MAILTFVRDELMKFVCYFLLFYFFFKFYFLPLKSGGAKAPLAPPPARSLKPNQPELRKISLKYKNLFSLTSKILGSYMRVFTVLFLHFTILVNNFVHCNMCSHYGPHLKFDCETQLVYL